MPDTHNSDYEEGVRDGRISTLESRDKWHTIRGDNHERRLIHIERIIYGMVGILFLSTMWPKFEVLLGAMAK